MDGWDEDGLGWTGRLDSVGWGVDGLDWVVGWMDGIIIYLPTTT